MRARLPGRFQIFWLFGRPLIRLDQDEPTAYLTATLALPTGEC